MMDKKPRDAGCVIRVARREDSETVRNLYAQLCPDVANVERDFLAMLNDSKAVCLIIEIAGMPAGMVLCYVRSTLSSGRKMVVDEIVIKHDLRGQRLGSLLLYHCVGIARSQGLDSVEVGCSLTKSALHRFYEKAGFKHRMRLYSMLLK